MNERQPFPKGDYASRRLVDTSDEKFQTSPGLKRWATIENLKIAAQSYAEAESITKLEHEISVKPKPENQQSRALRNWNTVSKTLQKSSNMLNSIGPIAPIISATKKPRTRTHISVDMKVRLSSMVVQDECLNRRALT